MRNLISTNHRDDFYATNVETNHTNSPQIVNYLSKWPKVNKFCPNETQLVKTICQSLGQRLGLREDLLKANMNLELTSLTG